MALAIATGLSLTLSACGGSEAENSVAPIGATSWIHHWNVVAVDASGLDHTPLFPGEPRQFGEQLGPVRASRAMAIVHIAVFEAVNAITGGYRSYLDLPPAPAGTSLKVAIGYAAHDTLAALFPSQAPAFAAELAQELASVDDSVSVQNGRAVGQQAASAILTLRANDGADHPEPHVGVDYIFNEAAGFWRQDPISRHPLALGARWMEVEPFVIDSPSQFRIPPPPALTSRAYAQSFAEVKALGGDGITTPTLRTADQTVAGIYWAYDGMPSLCAPPRLYNQIAVHIAEQMGSDIVELARLLALVNVTMADAGIAAWESKYYYDFWRPVTGIREANPGTGPSGSGDGNSETEGDATFSPLGAPASNLSEPNFTPPFPAYPSGHATFGGALFQTLRNVYGTDAIAFTFVSDEYNGVTRDADGSTRPLLARHFESLSQAEEENGQSRIYLGIHWSFDKTAGIAQGRQVADAVFARLFTPDHP